VHDVAQPDELEKLRQAPVHAVKPEQTSAAGHNHLQPRQRIYGAEIGWHQPRNIELDDSARRPSRRCRPARQHATVSPGLVLLVRRRHRSPLSASRAPQKKLRLGLKLVASSASLPRGAGEEPNVSGGQI
jgi:hypothetical protein